MIFTSRKLEAALASGEVSGWDAARYYFVPMILGSVIATPCWLLRPRFSFHPKSVVILTQYGLQILSAVLVYRGIKKCFRTNHQIDGQDFISRMVILCFPVFIKVVVLSIVVSLTLLQLAMRLVPAVHPQIFAAALGPLMTFVTFSWINRSLNRFGVEKSQTLDG